MERAGDGMAKDVVVGEGGGDVSGQPIWQAGLEEQPEAEEYLQ